MLNQLYRSTAAALLGMSVLIAMPAVTRGAGTATTKPATTKPEKPAMGKPGETAELRDARMGWWRDARFGMFIHWGAYAVPAAGE